MELLNRLFGRFDRCPQDLTDDVYPIHWIDQAGIIRSSIINYTFRYDDVLDPEKLRASLVQLLEFGDWKKFGGRLRKNGSGRYELHVPFAYSSARSAFRYSNVRHDSSIEQHPLGSRLPKATAQEPSVHEGCHSFRAFSVPEGLPDTIEHYLKTDEPVLSLLITSFSNATLVSLTFPHSLMDAMGTSELLRAWSCTLADRADQVPRLVGAREDVIDAVGSSDDEKGAGRFALEDKRLRGLSLVAFVIGFIWDLLTRRNVQVRTVYLPSKFMFHIRKTAEAQLRHDLDVKVTPFVSDGDLILAWFSRVILSSRYPKRPAMICNVFDIRKRLSSIIPGAAYLQNLIVPATTLLRSDEVQSFDAGQIALRLRQAIIDQATDDQTRSQLRVAKSAYKATGQMPVFATPDSSIILCTNWSKANFLKTADFGPAVVSRHSSRESAAPPGEVASFWGTTNGNKDHPRDTIVIYGKDRSENQWIHGYLRKETWALIEQTFRLYIEDNGNVL